MHTQIGFELGNVKHYATPEACQHFVEKNLEPLIKQGVVFNILVVQQLCVVDDIQNVRYVPLLNCWRVPNTYLPGVVGAMAAAARMGYTCFM